MHDHGLQTDAGRQVLLADIGGTNARFALADTGAAMPLLEESIRRYAVADFRSLGDAARRYLADAGLARGALRRGVFAVAGHVADDGARMTNHPWVVSRRRLRESLGLEDARLVNDFTAQAMALPLLEPAQLAGIGAPHSAGPKPGSKRTFAVMGPGTGLGIGGLLLRDGRAIALETEGGHAGFAPGTPLEAALLDHLARDYGRVSNERLLSGPGLVNI
ncbi:MAG: glucokinase, partial [Gammaproteobacteria bacterium]|nr:glucokinase [Gammaproteobacteria bacterium]